MIQSLAALCPFLVGPDQVSDYRAVVERWQYPYLLHENSPAPQNVYDDISSFFSSNISSQDRSYCSISATSQGGPPTSRPPDHSSNPINLSLGRDKPKQESEQ